MGFVQPENDDLFVSYAHVDDEPAEGVETGWVTTLVRSLKRELARKLGRPDAASVWMDHRLGTNLAVTPEIEDRIRRCAALLLVLSPGYLASQWCRRELRDFLTKEVGQRKGTSTSVFVVEYDRVERPKELSDLLGKRFWEADPDDQERSRTIGFPRVDPADRRYYDLLNDLCFDIVKELRRLAQPRPPGPPSAPGPPSPGRTIYLAEASEDLEDPYDEVKRYLTQQGYRVLPERVYPPEPAAFEEAVRGDLSASRLFVQLLSELPGKKLEGSDKRRVAVQYECAVALKKPVLHWRRGGIDASKVANPAHRALLTGPEVMEVELEEFKAAIVQRERRLSDPSRPHRPPPSCFIFVNMTEEDHDIAHCVAKELQQYEAWTALPVQTREVAEDTRDFEDNVRECDGLLLVYGKTKPQWVRAQLRQLRKLAADRNRPLSVIGVYDGPPPKSGEIEMGWEGLRILCGRDGPPRQELQAFVKAAREAGQLRSP
jgi:hypothetical protein